jgi:hypothetical protein
MYKFGKLLSVATLITNENTNVEFHKYTLLIRFQMTIHASNDNMMYFYSLQKHIFPVKDFQRIHTRYQLSKCSLKAVQHFLQKYSMDVVFFVIFFAKLIFSEACICQ